MSMWPTIGSVASLLAVAVVGLLVADVSMSRVAWGYSGAGVVAFGLALLVGGCAGAGAVIMRAGMLAGWW